MAITVGIVGQTGEGKSTSTVMNPDGKCVYLPVKHKNKADEYLGMDPEKTIIINADKKSLPFPGEDRWIVNKNVFNIDDMKTIMPLLKRVGESGKIKNVIIDTANGVMIAKEMRDIKLHGYDKWKDLATEVYELVKYCNESLPPDVIVFIMFHAALYTDIDGNERKCILTNGRKLEKLKPETWFPLILYARYNETGYQFETIPFSSTAKTPMGMFDEQIIPNSLSLVESKIREYYKL
jgi:hypothetical protein